jgi:EAL domain-containing protein (putative c-di-GMP-specific phosphodiesterase class I)
MKSMPFYSRRPVPRARLCVACPVQQAHSVPTDATLLDTLLEPGKLSVVFQPIFEVGSGQLTLHGLECLIRGPRGTTAERPGVLFEYIRRKRAEAAIDRACIAAALAEATQLPVAARLNLNVHASTLGRDLGFPGFLLDRAAEAGIPPGLLVIEIVEHAPPLDVPAFRRALAELREAGLTIALDDVGLGQSNYKMILDVRPDIYKLDRYLVAGAWNDPYRQVILDSLARMVRRLEARAVAEGVEDTHELVAVEAAGIDLVQGFLFARPMPLEAIVKAGLLTGQVPVVTAP